MRIILSNRLIVHILTIHLFKIKNLLILLAILSVIVAFNTNNINAQIVIDTIKIGPESGNGIGPMAVAVNHGTSRIYVANSQTGNISVINGETNAVIETIDVDGNPFGVSVNTITNRIYVVNANSKNISVIDGKTDTVIDIIDVVVDELVGVAVNPITNRIYVISNGIIDFTTSKSFITPLPFIGNINVIDGETNTIIKTIEVQMFPSKIVVNPVTNIVYVANQINTNICVVDGKTDSLITTIDVGIENQTELPLEPGIAINPTTNHLYYVAYPMDNNIMVRQTA